MSQHTSPADLGEEPEGFWEAVHEQVDEWVERFILGEEDGGDAD